MVTSVWIKAAVLWMAILVLAILNGAFRDTMLTPEFGSVVGFTLSGFILSICIVLVAFAAAPWYGRLNSRQWFAVGLFWLVLTLIFEFGFGRSLQQKSWGELFSAYTFQGGNIWPIVLLVTFLSPWLAAKLRKLI